MGKVFGLIMALAGTWASFASGPAASTNDAWDISNDIVITGHSPLLGGFDINAMFGANTSVEPGRTIFANVPPTNGNYFVEWRTASPINLETVNLYAGGDGPAYLNEREFNQFILQARLTTNDAFTTIYTFTPTHPYTFLDSNTFAVASMTFDKPVSAQYFRAEFVQYVSGRTLDGPRIVELDGFGDAYSPLQFTIEPTNQVARVGETVSFTAEAVGNGPVAYQWLLNGTNIPGANSNVLILGNLQLNEEGDYVVRATDTYTNVLSSSAHLTVLPDIYTDTNDLFDVSQGAVITDSSPIHSGSAASDMFGTSLSSEPGRTLFADGMPSNYVHYIEWKTPTLIRLDQIALYAGGDGSEFNNEREFNLFTLKARSSTNEDFQVIYQYEPTHPYTFLNASNFQIVSTTFTNTIEAKYFRAEFEQFDAGRNFDGPRIVELDGYGEALTESLRIVSQPTNQFLNLGETATFSVTAEGQGKLLYQWFHNGSEIPGAESNVLVIHNIELDDAGGYKVQVSDAETNIMSVVAQLDINIPPVTQSPSKTDLFDISRGNRVVGTSGINPNFEAEGMFGGELISPEQGSTLFAENRPDGYRHYIEWKTVGPVNLQGFNLFASGDPEIYLYEREFSEFVLKAKSDESSTNYDQVIYTFSPTHPYSFTNPDTQLLLSVTNLNVTAQSFRAEFVQRNVGRGYDAPRVIELDGFGLLLSTNSPVVADWTFEEGTPGTVMQIVKDWSGKGHDGVAILGQPQFVQSGPGSEGLVSGFFPSGNGPFGSGFRAQDSVDFNLGTEFTIEASINPGLDNNEANRGIVVGQDAASGRLVYAVDYRSETRTVDFAIISANGDGLFVPAILPDDDRSHHIAGVFGGQEIRIYLDGVLAASKPCLITPGIAPGGAARVTVGANDIGGYWFNGTLDRVRITAQALSPTEFFSESSQSNILGIVQGPADLTVAQGGTATFNVLAVGPQPLIYQWTFNTNNIPGATNSTLIITNVQAGDAGVYEVIVMSGTNHMEASALLTISDLNTPPVILQQPSSQTNYVGSSAQFSVVAEGSEPLTYLWSFNGSLLTLGTNNTLVITNLDLGNAGSYSVLVTNNYGSVTSRVAYLSVVQPDLSVPQITILSPESGTTTNDVVTVTGSVTDNVGTVRFEWFKNGQLVGPLPVTNGTFTLPNVVLVKGQNVLRFQAFDAAGNMGSATVYLNLEASRMLIISPVDSVQEGAPVTLPIYVKSAGDIGAITFTLNYDSRFLSNPELDFVKTQVGIFTQVNYASSNRIRATFALPGQTIAAGSNLIATVSFMTRSVPQDTTVPLKLDLQGVFNAAGDPITSGTEVKSTSLWIRQRKYIGDNNANDRLDVGDASIIMRLVSLLDPVRPWDVTGNDLNSTGSLDAGDIIRVLRTVVHIDPQPGETNHHSLSANSVIITRPVFQHEEIVSDAKLELYPDKTRVVPREKVTFKVKLTSPNIEAVSGASFGLRYPANVLRLENENAIQAGTMVPSDAAWLWNLSPAQNDFSIQDGVIYMAFSSASGWGTTNDTLAELTFTALPGISERYLWTITATEITVTSGYNFGLRLLDVEGTVTGRDPVAATLGVVNFNPQNGGFQLQVQGELGAQYRIEVSEDLKTWNELGVQVNQTGSLNVSDPASAQSAHRYYRVTQID